MSNVYGDTCTPNLGGVSNYYTKEQINNLLKAKPNSSQVYTKSYLDSEFTDIQNTLGSLSTSSVTQQNLSESLDSLESSILGEVSNLYALKSNVYTTSEIDQKISDLNIDPSDFVKTLPNNDQDNVVYPGSVNIPALTLRGSSTNPYIQKWLSNNSDLVGCVSNDGSVVFERGLEIGRLVSNGETALSLNLKRISNLGDPVNNKDAVNFSFLKEYVVNFFDPSGSAGGSLTDYVDSAITSHVEDPDAHIQYEKVENLGTAAYTDSSEYATSAQGNLADSAIQPEDPGLFNVNSFSQLTIDLGVRAFGIGVPGEELFGIGPVAYGDFPLAITVADYFPIDPSSGSFV
jgi:hypothetical protein